MAVTKHEEYKTQEDQTISIQRRGDGTWEVGCWNEDDTCHWYFEYSDEAKARAEFERWRA